MIASIAAVRGMYTEYSVVEHLRTAHTAFEFARFVPVLAFVHAFVKHTVRSRYICSRHRKANAMY